MVRETRRFQRRDPSARTLALKEARVIGKRDMQDKGFQFRITLRPLAILSR